MSKISHIIILKSRISFPRTPFSGISFYLPLLFSLVLSACNTAPVIGDEKALSAAQISSENNTAEVADTAINAEAEVSQNAGTKPKKKSVSLDGDMLFNLMAAEFAGNSGDIETSLTYYREASKSIEDSRIAARTAYIAQYGEQYDETLAALDRWHELEPDAKDIPRMYAVTYLRMEQPEKAVSHIKDMLLIYHETSANEAVAVKQLLAKESNSKDAYVVLQKLNKKDKKNAHLLVLQSRYAAQLKKYDEALALLDEVLEIDPSLYEVLIIKARILTAQGQHEEATLLIKQVLVELPENSALRLQYARMLVEQRKMKEATEQYSILHKKLPEDGEITLSLALLYIETKQMDKAVETLQYLIEIDKKVPVANYYLGRITQNQGDEKKAISYYLGVKSSEYAYDSQLRIGVLLAVLGKADEGLAKLEALAEEQNSWSLRVKAYLAQGEILRSEHRYKEGVEMYSRALQQKRDDTTLLYARGLMAEKVDRLDMAEADLLKVISKEPDNADALNALGYTLADRTSRYKEAQEYIKRAAALVPDDPAILDSLGWVSYRLGEMDEALKWLSKAFAKLEDAEIAAHYGEVLWHTNQKDKAREVWNKGKDKDAKNKILIETLDRIKP
ncbi:FIG140336: TPR domain protein [hydrothermal vent metagenome]|uniref:FIG140336: TPR domain protein n=1 Tax=hydrothermal vent metagenome TaxID=652676 RepID=A0A3B0X2N0_9ZZZZ